MTTPCNQKKPNFLNLPDFLELSIDPKGGYQLYGLNFWTYQWKNSNEFIHSFGYPTFNSMLTSASIGGTIGFLHSITTQKSLNLRQASIDALKWMIPAALIGLGFGIHRYKSYSLKSYKVMENINPYQIKAKEILESVLEKITDDTIKMDNLLDKEDLFCPISSQIMAYPIKTNCSPAPHTFDFYSIFKLFEKSESVPCPLCRKSLTIDNLSLNKKIEETINSIVKKFFIKMESLLIKFPSYENIPDFCESQIIDSLYERIESKIPFLPIDQKDEITESILQEKSLDIQQLFALSYFFIYQIYPIQHKIDQIYQISGDYLLQLRIEGRIRPDLIKEQETQLHAWYKNFKVIPHECKTILKIYRIAKEKLQTD